MINFVFIQVIFLFNRILWKFWAFKESWFNWNYFKISEKIL